VKYLLSIILLWCFADVTSAQQGFSITGFDLETALETQGYTPIDAETGENSRLVSAALCLALGPFGMHRLYLGTDVAVPIFYTLTLGGGLGILPAIDFFFILFTGDLAPFHNNPKMVMWGEGKEP